MKGLLSANVRAHARRYVATGLAVAISAAFVVLFFSFTSGLSRSMTQAEADRFTGVSAVVTPGDDATLEEDVNLHSIVDDVSAVDGVTAVSPVRQAVMAVSHEGKRVTRALMTLNPEPFSSPALSRGELPTTSDGILISEDLARALSVDVGSTVDVSPAFTEDAQSTTMTVTGVTTSRPMQDGLVYVTGEGMDHLPSDTASTDQLLVAGESPTPSNAQQEELAVAISAALADQGLSGQVTVAPAYEAVAEALKYATAGMEGLKTVLSPFPLISVVVSIIIVSTTFQVVMTQRTRELALLRALGATRSQVRSLIARETILVGAISSAVGVLSGALLAGLGLWALDFLEIGPAFVTAFSPQVLVLTWLAGTAIAWIAGRRPAARMSDLSPVAALSSTDVTVDRRERSRRSLVIFSVLSAVGIAGIALGLTMRGSDMGFLVTFLATMLLLPASMGVCAAFFPAVAHLLGGLTRSMTGRLARENVVRAPGRTAATAVAITIGVTLITTMGVGAASTRETILSHVDDRRPVDYLVTSTTGSISDSQIEQLKNIEGTNGFVAVRGETLVLAPAGQGPELASTVEPTTSEESYDPNASPLPALALVEGYPDLSPATHSPVAVIPDSVVRVSPYLGATGESLDVCTQPSSTDAQPICRTLTIEASETMDPAKAEVSAATLASLAPDASYTTAFIRLASPDEAAKVESRISSVDSSLIVGGAAPERAMYTNAINGMLTGALALLGVSVVVALVGVSNTLSLSVAERTRENGLLRALGMSRRSVRRMLSIEAILISLAGSVIGIILGTIFGVIGTAALPLQGVQTTIAIPWLLITAVLGLSLVAAVLASWLPGRRAAQTSPVEALAHE
nr:FtsX-like permease family protein [Actinomyces sp.]